MQPERLTDPSSFMFQYIHSSAGAPKCTLVTLPAVRQHGALGTDGSARLPPSSRHHPNWFTQSIGKAPAEFPAALCSGDTIDRQDRPILPDSHMLQYRGQTWDEIDLRLLYDIYDKQIMENELV